MGKERQMLNPLSKTIILGLYALDTVITKKKVNGISLSGENGEISLGGPPTFIGFISKVIKKLYPAIEETFIYSYICKEAQSLLKDHPANLSQTMLIKSRNCPRFRLEYSHLYKDRKLSLNHPPNKFDYLSFHWHYETLPVICVSSVYQEFSNPELFTFLSERSSYIAFDPQGCFRKLNQDGKITFSEWFSPEIVSRIKCIKLSENEAKSPRS